MKKYQAAEHSRQAIIRLCHSQLDSRELRVEVLRHLQAVIPFDYAYFSTTDPATQLFTSSVVAEEPPAWMMTAFLDNEFLQEDFLKFRSMFAERRAVGVLSEAARGALPRSLRFRNMLAPLAMGDELRAIFVKDAACWGTLCLHRAGSGYTSKEAVLLAGLTTTIAGGLRRALLWDGVAQLVPESPGVLILEDCLSVSAMTASAAYWLEDLVASEKRICHALPLAVRNVVAALHAVEAGMLSAAFAAKVRVRARSGHWLVLHASRLQNPAGETQIAVIFEVAQPTEISPLIIQAYGLTRREGEVARCVLLGWSTAEISASLHISPNTVQDHLKSIFEKVDVSSRGELAHRLFNRQFQPSIEAGSPVAARGQFHVPGASSPSSF